MRTEPALGIDLGTTFSVAACLDREGRPWTVQNAEGDLKTPSVVFFDKTSIVVGREALKAAEFEPERVARFVKRDMGRKLSRGRYAGRQFPPEVIQALVLKKLRDDSERKLGAVHKAVITVPAYFDEPRRKATQDAGRIAGLEVLDIVNEPTAAAVCYGVQQRFLTAGGESRRKETILVYDLGGGTFDATLMEIDGCHYRTLATEGDVYLGGVDWDKRLADDLAAQFHAEHGSDPRDDAGSYQRLLQEAEEAKHALTARDEATVLLSHGGARSRILVTRERFLDLTSDLLERTHFTVRKVLREARREWKDVTRLLLVGGSTRMPAVQQMLERETGLPLDQSLSPDEAVAHGAAIYAGLLMRHGAEAIRDVSVGNVNSHDLGVVGMERASGRPRRHVMIPRNTPLPARKASRFDTYQDNQPSVAVNIVEGGDASGRNAAEIGRCVVRDLPPNLPAGTPVVVEFQYGENGRLSVLAELPQTGKSAAVTIERACGLSDERVAFWRERLASGTLLDESLDEAPASPGDSSPKPPPLPQQTPPPLPTQTPTRSAAPVSSADVVPAKRSPASGPRPDHGARRSPPETHTQRPDSSTSQSPDPADAPRQVAKPASGPAIPSQRKRPRSKPAQTAAVAAAVSPPSPAEPAPRPRPGPQPAKPQAVEAVLSEQSPPRAVSAAPPILTDTPAAPLPPVSSAPEQDENELDEHEQISVGQQASVFGVSLAIHLVALLVMYFIVVPPNFAEPLLGILGSMPEPPKEQPKLEETKIDLKPKEITEEKQKKQMIQVADLNAKDKDKFEIDVNDLEPAASVIPNSNATAPAAQAPFTGQFAGRSKGGRAALLIRYGGTKESESAVHAGLEWLRRHQNSDGSWTWDHTRSTGCNCGNPGMLKDATMGSTAMALLCFLGAGHTFSTGDYQPQVEAALLYLLKNGKNTPRGGDFRGKTSGNADMYVHGLVTIALCEADAMYRSEVQRETETKIDKKLSREKQSALRKRQVARRKRAVVIARKLDYAARAAVQFVITAQDDDGGWRYKPNSRQSDTSVVGWQVMGLASAHSARIPIPGDTVKGATKWLDSVQSGRGRYGPGSLYGYTTAAPRPSTTAVGLLCRIYLGWGRGHPSLREGVEYLSQQGPSRSNMYYNYYATQVMHQYGGKPWPKWNNVMRDQLVDTQVKAGHARGSWNLTDPHGRQGGRLYQTCLSIMTLEVYYRHLPLYELRKSQGTAATDKIADREENQKPRKEPPAKKKGRKKRKGPAKKKPTAKNSQE